MAAFNKSTYFQVHPVRSGEYVECT